MRRRRASPGARGAALVEACDALVTPWESPGRLREALRSRGDDSPGISTASGRGLGARATPRRARRWGWEARRTRRAALGRGRAPPPSTTSPSCPGTAATIPPTISTLPSAGDRVPARHLGSPACPSEPAEYPGDSARRQGHVAHHPGEHARWHGDDARCQGYDAPVPGRARAIPGRRRATPGQVRAVPGQVRAVPGRVRAMPGRRRPGTGVSARSARATTRGTSPSPRDAGEMCPGTLQGQRSYRSKWCAARTCLVGLPG